MIPRAMWLSPSDQIFDFVSAQLENPAMATYSVFPLDEGIRAEGHANCCRIGLLNANCRILAPFPFAIDMNSAKSNMVVCDVCQSCRPRSWRAVPWAPFERKAAAIWDEVWVLFIHHLLDMSELSGNPGSKGQANLVRASAVESCQLANFPSRLIPRCGPEPWLSGTELHTHYDILSRIVGIS